MIVAPDTKTVYFDIDSTLVFATGEFPEERKSCQVVYIGGRCWLVHEPHVECIRNFSARGHNIILWSAGGAAWAAEVAKALRIDALVLACLSKPDWYFDDKPVSAWLSPLQHCYLKV